MRGRKSHRNGKKYRGDHTTLIPAAENLCDRIEKIAGVEISLGFIKQGLPSVNGQIRVKIADKSGGILLTIRGNTSAQEITVYTFKRQEAKLAIARAARDLDYHIAFGGRRSGQ